MGGAPAALSGPDFTKGFALADVPEGGMVLGNAHGEAVLVVRHGGQAFALGATCTHYGAPLVDGLAEGRPAALPLAPRLLRRRDRRSGVSAGPECLAAVASRAAGRSVFCERAPGIHPPSGAPGGGQRAFSSSALEQRGTPPPKPCGVRVTSAR